MILVTTEINPSDNKQYVSSISVIPKVMGPKNNLAANQHMFTDQDIPSDFYRNYKSYYIADGILHYNPSVVIS